MSESAYIGVDLGGTAVKIVATGADGAPLGSRHEPTDAGMARDALLARIAGSIRKLRAEVEAARPGMRVAAVGLAVPGVIDAQAGRVEFTVALAPDWNGFAAAAALERVLGLPALLVNDAQAATFGESLWGGGRGYRDFVCITVGTGIGGGIVLDGRLYPGSRGMSGVLGHTTVLPDGPPCACGNRGCLETLASGTAIARAATERWAGGGNDEPPTPRRLAEAAQGGDPVAREIFAESGTFIGIALGNVVLALNPRAIVVGGGVSQAGEVLLEPIRAEIKRRTSVFSAERGGVDVIQSPLGTDAGAIGSAAWAAKGAGGS